MLKVNANAKITSDIVAEIIRQYQRNDIVIVIDNTKLQDEDALRSIASTHPSVRFSVLGGLNPKKNKFNSEHYQERTYLTPMELSKIVSIFRDIEKNIDLSWNDTEKAMYIYKQICDRMEYSENRINGKDCARGLNGLLYNKAVCAGFAIIYKEALDRIGIECHYQNRQRHHSWNIAKLDGEYRAIELTWEVGTKTESGCEFRYFGRDMDFYKNKHHDISNESEETTYRVVTYKKEELTNSYRIITKPKVGKYEFDNNGLIELNIEGNRVVLKKRNDKIALKGNAKYKFFSRDDGTSFMIVQKGKTYDNLYEHVVIEIRSNGIQVGKIYSEEMLTNLPEEYSPFISNGLLSTKRLARKIRDFNGYVGYIGQNHRIYAIASVEEKLNMRR